MRFVSFAGADGRPVAGIIRGEQVVDLSHASCQSVLGGTPPSLLAFIEQGLARWAARLAEASFHADAMRPLAEVKLLAPLRPGKIAGAAFNFTDALAERGMAHPAEPVTFVRSGSTVIGPGDVIDMGPPAGDAGMHTPPALGLIHISQPS
jgi:2,4-diketo-3-deoxy-L-fuconate hydrolase